VARIAEVAKQGGRLIWYPGQVDVSIRPGWFYHAAEDDKVKTLDHLLDIYYTSVGGNAQLLLNIPPDKRGRIHENDAARLRELGLCLKTTFADNLTGITRDWSGEWAQKDTRDMDPVPARSELVSDNVLELTGTYIFERPRLFNVALVAEEVRNGQRIEAFALDAWDGTEWREIVRGTTVGYKKLLRFPAVETSKVRLRILRARGTVFPILPPDGFGLFLDTGRHSLPGR
jgi:alpha-L-fucosidase